MKERSRHLMLSLFVLILAILACGRGGLPTRVSPTEPPRQQETALPPETPGEPQKETRPNQGPINVIFAIHVEPFLPQFGYDYGDRREELYWLRDKALYYGAKLSLASNGEFMEWVEDLGDEDLVQSYLDAGFDWGTHIHPLWQRERHDWVLEPPDAPPDTVRLIWQSNVDAVEAIIGSENNYGVAPYQTHQPLMVELMKEFDFHIQTALTEPAGEMAYENLGHYPFNPFRPCTIPGRYLKEDLTQTQFVLIPHYPQLEPNPGATGPRSLETNQKYFLMEYIEWLHHQREGLPEKVWVFGIATHDCYNAANRAYIEQMLIWLNNNFIGKTTPTGWTIAEYASATEVADEFFEWEESHPGESSFSWEPGESYPYTYSEMPELLREAEYDTTLNIANGIACHKFTREEGSPIYVLWSWSGTQEIDFSSEISGQVQVYDGKGGSYIAQATALKVTEEPLFVEVASEPARVSSTETPRRQETTPPPQGDVEVNGSLEEVNGVRVLRVWGSRQEMGFAQGYLLADDLMDLFEHVLFDSMFAKFPRQWTYERVVSVMKEHIVWPEGYREEMEAIIRGMEAALEGLPEISHERIETGSVAVNADMVAILNAHTDLIDLPRDCCSFATWGAATGDGQTRVGGNQQGQRGPLHDYALLMVRQPEDGLSTACSNIPGSLTCMRGLNETGVAMMPQGAETPWIEIDGPCYAGMHGRLVLEQVAAGPDMVSQVVEVFETHPRCGSSIFLFAQGTPTWSDPDADQMAVVIEHDYEGVTARLPSHNALHGNPLTEAIVATNHFLRRETPASHPAVDESDRRYQAMVAVIQEGVNDLADMQEVLIACDRGGVAQQTVYVEPDTMTIHVAFRPSAEAPTSAAQTPVSFTWEELFPPR